MGIFGFFGKKGSQKDSQAAQKPTDKEALRQKQAAPPAQSVNMPVDAERLRQENAARANATAKKIDAIESEMSSAFGSRALPDVDNLPVTPTQRPSPFNDDKFRAGKGKPQTPPAFESTLPSLGMSTDFLLGVEGKTIPVPIEIVAPEASQIIEEAAIHFANGLNDLVEQLLRGAVEDGMSDPSAREAWWMLFDLYQITGKQQQFETLSIDYASKFETSPPSWIKLDQAQAAPGAAPRVGATPTVGFSGKLDGSIIKLLERIQKLSENSPVLRLEFTRITEVDPVGCGLLLRILKKLQDSGRELILAGAPELAGKIRSILQAGRRDETEAPWLLLLEMLRLLNNEQEFEEVSMDYCITFEVSPPAFVAPKDNVRAALDDAGNVNAASDSFVMPTVVEGHTDQLMSAITAFAGGHEPAIFDCSRLNRIDFSAAGQLLSCLAPLAVDGKTIEMQDVNHLVAALLNVIGMKDIARIVPRRL